MTQFDGEKNNGKKVHSFKSEIQQLLHLVVHSLYSHREIFLRELVSNASDAIDKLKFEALTRNELLPSGYEPKIQIQIEKEKRHLKITDNGIGMTEAEVIENIGTIAKSGTQQFLKQVQEMQKRPELIGQFGVGFYSAFMVAKEVLLHTQKAGSNEGTLWRSVGDGTYEISSVPRTEGFGTTITLVLKEMEENDESAQDYTDEWEIKNLIKKYSDFIAHPLFVGEEKVNSQKALWQKSPAEVTPEEHKEFYKHISHDWNDPARTIHFKAEGTMEFTALMYIPGEKPWNYNYRESKYGLSLYVKRVFIMADCEELLPPYLRFVKGLVDSSDLSLNVSREMLQQDKQLHQIRKSLVNKLLSQFKEWMQKDRGAYEKFWSQFGATLKEGLSMDSAQKDKLAEVTLFKSLNKGTYISLEEYIQNKPEAQKQIYFLTGEQEAHLKASPFLEKLGDKNYDVLLMTDPVDDWVVRALTEYKELKLISLASDKAELESEVEKSSKEAHLKELEDKYKSLLGTVYKTLESDLKEVKLSSKLKKSVGVLVSTDGDLTPQMEKLLAQMGQAPKGMKAKRILELNADHPVLARMSLLPTDQQEKWAQVIYSQALLCEGSQLPDPVAFAQNITELMLSSSPH